MPKLGRKTPCQECPWLRKSAPGYLGDDNPEHFFRASVTRESLMPCHMQIDYSDPDWANTQLPGVDFCAGNLIFYRNWLKQPRNPDLYAATRAVNPSQHVFLTPEEFFEHHAPGRDPGMMQRALWPYAPEDDVYDREAG